MTLRRLSVTVSRDAADAARAAWLGLFPEGFEERECATGVELVAYADPAAEQRARGRFPHLVSAAVEPGWQEGWRAFHVPVVVGPLWIGPPWERPSAAATAVVIDPGRAFGTGAHATTRLCVELLVALEPGSLLDVGAGSGVLAIAAAKLGFDPVAAIDLDEAAVAAARENAAANGVELDVRR
ncbi:MAG: 50S ribosomal protein L11 methyltransferase, partial [Thermoleophilia bacterium]|nr:50S ribosomal protein L11 methyltransferase [Thermoleophilia bacterium]